MTVDYNSVEPRRAVFPLMGSQTSPSASPKLELSLAQVLGSAAATISAAVLTSFAGIKGTLIGAAAMSVIATVGSAVYSYALRRSHTRLRRSLASARAGGPSLPPLPRLTRRGRVRLALLAAPFVVFGLAFAVITIVEAVVGAPLAQVVSGHDGGGTTISHTLTGGGRGSRPGPPSPTVPGPPTATSTAPTASPGAASPTSPPATAASPAPTSTRSAPLSPAPTRTWSTPSTTASPAPIPTPSPPSKVPRSTAPTSGATSPSLPSPAGPQPSSHPAPSAPGTSGPSG